MSSPLTLSINPLYKCNFRCSFCYLTKEQLSDKTTLDLKKLSDHLVHLTSYRDIGHIDLYGGEITLLPDSYIDEMLSVVRRFYHGPINLVTNLSRVTPLCTQSDISLSVSWDGDLRQDHHKVISNIMSLDKEVHILMLASPEMLDWSDEKIDEVCEIFNTISNISSVEIKPYSSNQANSFPSQYRDFENFMIRWLKRKDHFRFSFINDILISESLNGKKNAWSDDHLYITPNGELAVLEFDKNFNEFFLPLKDYSQYLEWCVREKEKIHKNVRCRECEYLGTCLSEHLKDHYSPKDSCDGFKGLLDWQKNLKEALPQSVEYNLQL